MATKARTQLDDEIEAFRQAFRQERLALIARRDKIKHKFEKIEKDI